MALIYVVEDDKNISEIESFALKNAGHQIVECACAKEFHKQVQERIPDMVLLDIMLPDEDGLSILKKLRATPETRRIPVILVTAKTTEIDKVKGLDSGADDYLTKPFGVMELISRVKALLRRVGGMEDEKFLRVGILFIDDEKHVAYVDDKHIELTYKEYELLKYLTINQGIVLSRDNLMEKIWSSDYEGESRTLDVHIKTLRQKLGKYKFEDEEFKLLTYQKLKKGKKIYYRVTLNKNIRQKIKDKRYIKYNSRSLLEILTKDPIAGRIYKYISKIRYESMDGRINVRTLAAIIPLKTEQITERKNKNGEVKQYILCRLKQVLKRIEKAFDVLVEMGYILKYDSEYIKEEDNYYINYIFNKDKDGECHVSSFIENKSSKKVLAIPVERNLEVEEAEVIEVVKEAQKVTKSTKKSTSKAKDNSVELPESVIEKVQKAKRNIYVQRAWDKRTDTKIKKIFREDGEALAIEVLNILYKNLNGNIKTTLVQYINGVLKNISLDENANNKQNLTLFNNIVKEKGLKSKKKINQARRGVKKPVINSIKDIISGTDISKDLMAEFNEYDEFEKLKIEEQALKLCSQEEGIDVNFLLTMKAKSKNIYLNTIKRYIERVIKEG